MISQLLNTIERGFRVMQTHTHLFLVAALVFIFPLIFLLSSQSFFETASGNIDTSQRQRVGILHDSLAAILPTQIANRDLMQGLLFDYAESNTDIQGLKIAHETPDGYLIDYALATSTIGEYDPEQMLYVRTFSDPKESLIFQYTENGVRTWTAIRKIPIDGETYYVVSTHSMRFIDSIMLASRQQSYLTLTLIFGFLMALAYWLARQIHWRGEAEKLQKTLEERNLFTNMIAHEFRAPLTAINGYSSFLDESKTLTDDEHRYVDTIQLSVTRLLNLVNDFLEVAHIQSGKLKLQKEVVEVESIFDVVVKTLNSNATEKGLELKFDKPKLPHKLYTDPNRLTQVLTNIVSNSLKYTEKGSVTIECENNPLLLTIRVKDTGMGINADDQKKLFAPFMRVGGVEKTDTVGTGLGMWITKQLVELLGGTIGVESIKGVGTHIVMKFKHDKREKIDSK